MNNTLNVLITDNPETESVAIIVLAIEKSSRLVSDEFIVIELLPKLNQAGYGYEDQETLVETPAGFVTIVGNAIVKGVPIE